MRAELFAKDIPSIIASTRQLIAFGATGVNWPNKTREQTPAQVVQALASELSPEQMEKLCPHYSIKFNYDRQAEVVLADFEAFCKMCSEWQIRNCLLISGSGSRGFDTVACLKAMKLPHKHCPAIGVAFNPFFPTTDEQERENARLRLKLQTGRVSSVWLQIGCDIRRLTDGIRLVKATAAELGLGSVQLYGSIFIPSKRLIAQMKFRPWNGVFLSEEFLSSVTAAESVTRQVLDIYREEGVEVLVESSIRTEEEWKAVGLLNKTTHSLDAVERKSRARASNRGAAPYDSVSSGRGRGAGRGARGYDGNGQTATRKRCQ